MEPSFWLTHYDWPGNVRELLNLLEAVYINLPGKVIRCSDLPPALRALMESNHVPPRDERRAIVSALMETNWNKSNAAQKLQWSRMTLYRKMAKYRIVEQRSARNVEV